MKNLNSTLPLRFQKFQFSDSVKDSKKAVEELFCPLVLKFRDQSFSANDVKQFFSLTSDELYNFIDYLNSKGVIEPSITSFTLNELDEMAEAKKKEAFAESVVDSGDFDVSEDFDEEEEEDDEMSFDID